MDLATSNLLYECGELLGIKVKDCVIIGNGNFQSLADRGELKSNPVKTRIPSLKTSDGAVASSLEGRL